MSATERPAFSWASLLAAVVVNLVVVFLPVWALEHFLRVDGWFWVAVAATWSGSAAWFLVFRLRER
jgi:hypothetical protein